MKETPILISEEYLKLYSPIPNNYNWNDIKPFIPIAEEIWVTDILGMELYNELLEQVSNNEVEPKNATLLLKLYPYLSAAIVYEALPFIAYHINEKGMTKGKSDNSEPISNAELTNIQNHLRTQIESLKINFIKWINENADCFPSYEKKTYNDCFGECYDSVWIMKQIYGKDIDRKMVSRYLKRKNSPNNNNRLFSSNNNL